jgi:glucosylceramidase
MLAASLLATTNENPMTVTWRCSTNDNPWADKGNLTATVSGTGADAQVKVDAARRFQEIKGWGGCFNELGWDALSVLDPAQRQDVLASLFDPKTGCKFNICRMPIGASDFAMGYYSLDDTPGDYAMAHFSIDRDRQRLIPYIKAAMAIQPKLRVWGSAWSPPAWMKTNGEYAHGEMKQTPEVLSAYALYLEKTVEAFQAEGLHFYAVHVQNEPVYNDNVYPQCKWTGEQLRDFIKTYLGPQFKSHHVKADIWAGTFPTGDWGHFPGVILSDPDALKHIKGVSYQWGGREISAKTHDLYPQLELMESEMECGDATNNWGYGEYTFDLMREYLDGWVGSFMQWNMILDQTGKSAWGWPQNSMICINRETKAVTYNPQFYAAKHFSYYVAPGAHRIASTSADPDQIAFQNPNGDIVVVIKNPAADDRAVTISVGDESVNPSLPSHSISTLVFHRHR